MKAFIYRIRATLYMWSRLRAHDWTFNDCWTHCESFTEKGSYRDEGVHPHDAVLEDMSYWTE